MNVFERIYRSNGWNGRVSLSGPGSDPNASAAAARILESLVRELRIETIVSAGCGDDLWTPSVLDGETAYLGIDISPFAIARAKRHHPERSYRVGDIREGIPAGDLVLLRDVVQHLPAYDVERVIERIRASGSTWLLASTYTAPSVRHVPQSATGTIAPGGYWCPDLAAERFGLGEPERLYRDGYDYDVLGDVADPSKWLGLWRLPTTG